MIEVTQYEKALVRLRAFKLLNGWGDTTDGVVEPWDFYKRRERAFELADWALHDPVTIRTKVE